MPVGSLVGLAMIVLGALFLYVRHESPWFPDPDLIRYGLFTGPLKSVDTLLIEMCNEADGEPTMVGAPCAVVCSFPNGHRWETRIHEDFCWDVAPRRRAP